MSGIQSKIDELRSSGTTKVLSLQSSIDAIKSDRLLTKQPSSRSPRCRRRWTRPSRSRAPTSSRWAMLIADGEAYLKAHYDKEYLTPVKRAARPSASWRRRSTRSA